jgi:hypothetical protein
VASPTAWSSRGRTSWLGRRYGIYVIHTQPTSPYTQSWTDWYVTDLGYVEGDWVPRDVTVTNNTIVYTRPDGDDTNAIDVAENIVETFTSLAGGGVWKRSATNANRYVWEPTPAFASTMAAFKVTASSVAEVRASGDSLILEAVFDMNPPVAAAASLEPRGTAALVGAILLLGAGVVLRRHRRVLAVLLVGATGLGIAACDLGTITFSARFRYEFRLANPALTASAEDGTLPLVQLANGTGRMVVERYRSEWWQYIRDEGGTIVDSVAQVRTATGQATVNLGTALYQDGVITDDDDAAVSTAARLLQVPASAIRRGR